MKVAGRTLSLLLATWAVSICSCGSRSGPDLIDADAPTEFTTTDSGLKYRILRKSDGQKPSATSRVRVDYSGTLDSGKVFDSSYSRREPLEIGLQQVVPGWTEGLQLIGEGGMIELQIPSELGYGSQPPPGIPRNATLHFKVELHRIL